MSILTVIVGVLVANALTAAFAYYMWRIGKNESDSRAYIGILVLLAIVLLTVFAERQRFAEASQAAPYQSAVPASDRR
ncbi:hypothetical protein IQ24_02615 [Paracoccus sulfuroxidans]|uniref:Uncharacterized protein n=1 Tax=Paracoccus sulfuroxidans TaxID=384678 RepID=A0A562NKZ0_9RHOB|nr:hypothetical protein IQ24_02615 [Paracoccus sulfuroxidans]